MLVLGRYPSETLVMRHAITGEVITVMLVTCGNQPRIGIEAAKEWRIVRGELLDDEQPTPAEVTR